MIDKSWTPLGAVTLKQVQRRLFKHINLNEYIALRCVWHFLRSKNSVRGWLDVSPDFMLLSGCDGSVSLYGGSVFAPADLRGRVGFDLHSQLHVFLQLGWNVLFLGRFQIHKTSLCGEKDNNIKSNILYMLYTDLLNKMNFMNKNIHIFHKKPFDHTFILAWCPKS